MQPARIVVEENLPDHEESIRQMLREFNRQHGPPANYQPLGVLLQDPSGSTIGGLWGRSRYDWLFIDLLFIPAELRGQGLGSALLRQAEQIALSRGCIGVFLDTFAFQAPDFYQKLGYTIFGELKDHPRGLSKYWLQRRLDQ
jgi:GNAT superfamily N-acetyltransferase